MKIMSYNIQHGVGQDGVLDLERIGNVLKSSGATIIGIQEIDNHWSERSDFEDQAKWLAEYLKMEYVYAGNLDYEPLERGGDRRQYGIATLSKYPIVGTNHHLLTSGDEQRGVLCTTIDLTDGSIHFFNTHLGLNTEEREKQFQELLGITHAYENSKVVVGDFNAYPSEVISKMSKQFYDVFHNEEQILTFPSTKPEVRIDYIFASHDLKKVNAEVKNSLASDHLPIIAELNR